MNQKGFANTAVFIGILVLIVIATGYFISTRHTIAPVTPAQIPTEPANPLLTQTPSPVSTSIKPPIVDFFACGDYCPNPREQYMIKVYQGVKDPTECKNIGGTPGQFTGWGTTLYCEAK